MAWSLDANSPHDAPIEHLDGVRHGDAPLPRRLHRCRVQSRASMGFRLVERCPCGAIRIDGRHWMERNSRRKVKA